MSYTVRIGSTVTREVNKDDVIAQLMAQFNARTGNEIEVIWPDGSSILEEGFE
jgi:hypothetical protein